MTKHKKRKRKLMGVYVAGAMEGRKYEELFYEHFYVRAQLVSLGLDVFDPLLKEKHKPGQIVGLKSCGLKPYNIYLKDTKAVEEADIIFWVTGDYVSEGSITEIAWAGCLNRHKVYPLKHIIIISPLRFNKKKNHFANMHIGVQIFKCVDDGISYIRKLLSR